jgi:hypothetical protein
MSTGCEAEETRLSDTRAGDIDTVAERLLLRTRAARLENPARHSVPISSFYSNCALARVAQISANVHKLA